MARGQAFDAAVEQNGTVTLLRPLTKQGTEWLRRWVNYEPWQVIGGAIVCEPRMASMIADAMADDGLAVTA